MDKEKAKEILVEHTKALNVLLHNEGVKDTSVNIDADETLGSIEDREEKLSWIQQAFKKAQKIPAVETVSNLGVAGTVAVSSAVVTQTEIAKDTTETFVAEVAQDIVEERIEVPIFIDNFVDFEEVYLDWGQQVIAQKYVEAQSYAENVSSEIQSKVASGEIKVSEPQQTSQPTDETSDTKQETSASSNSSSSEKSAQTGQPAQTEQSSESEQKGQESKEDSSSEENKESKNSDQEQDKSDKQEQSQESKTEGSQESQESKSSSEPTTQSEEVKQESSPQAESAPEIPRVETPIDFGGSIRQVSPTN
jgi:hypothetical protein